jgi:hypothetical protein
LVRGRSFKLKLVLAKIHMEGSKKEQRKKTSKRTEDDGRTKKGDRAGAKNEDLHFYDNIEYLRSVPRRERVELRLGVSWMTGTMKRNDFLQQVEAPLKKAQKKTPEERLEVEQESIELETFSDAPDEDAPVNPYYPNSEEKLKNFLNPQETKAVAFDIISGRTTRANKRSRRKRFVAERRREMLNTNYRENKKCRICREETDNKTQDVVWTRCDCLTAFGKTPPALRYHTGCLKTEGITALFCETCDKEVKLNIGT